MMARDRARGKAGCEYPAYIFQQSLALEQLEHLEAHQLYVNLTFVRIDSC